MGLKNAQKALIFAQFLLKKRAFLLISYHFLLIFARFFLAHLAQTAQPNPSILVFTSKTHIPPKKNLKKSNFSPQFPIFSVLNFAGLQPLLPAGTKTSTPAIKFLAHLTGTKDNNSKRDTGYSMLVEMVSR